LELFWRADELKIKGVLGTIKNKILLFFPRRSTEMIYPSKNMPPLCYTNETRSPPAKEHKKVLSFGEGTGNVV
jgi:hypothetical protein